MNSAPTATEPRPHPSWFAAILAGFVVVHLTLLTILAFRVPATADEIVYMGAGHAIRTDFTFETWVERLQGPVPLLCNQTYLPADPDDLQSLLPFGRLGMLPFSLLLLLVLGCWSRQLWGTRGAVLTLVLATFSPNLLGYGALTATDLAFSATAVATLWAFWHWLRRPSFGLLMAWGALFGVCIATKYLALLLSFAFPLVVVLHRLRDGLGQLLRGLGAIGLAGAASLVTVHACYLFQVPWFDAFEQLQANGLAGIGSLPVVGDLLRLLPEPLVLGIDHQKNVASVFPPGRFLDGIGGHWAYYFVSIGGKMPLGALALIALSLLSQLPRAADPERTRGFHLAVAVPSLLLLVYTSLFSDLQIGIRYVLPLIPLLLLHAGGWLAQGLRFGRARVAVAAMLCCYMLIAVLLQWPHLLAFCNPLIGGQAGAHRWFVDSNCEWGQTRDEGREVLMARDPELAFVPRHSTPRLGRVAAYVSDLKPDDPRRPGRTYHWLDGFDPVDHYAAAWLVYDLHPSDYQRRIVAGDERAAQELALAHLYDRDFAAARAAIARAPEHQVTGKIEQLIALCERDQLAAAVALMAELDCKDLIVSFLEQRPQANRLALVRALVDIGRIEAVNRLLDEMRANGTYTTQYALQCARVLVDHQRYREAQSVIDEIGDLAADDPLLPIVQAARLKLADDMKIVNRLRLSPR